METNQQRLDSQFVEVTVCIATFKRLTLLRVLLDSLLAQRLPPQVAMRIVVVDNDVTASARPMVEDFARSAPFSVVYDVEPEQNIALARNRALAHASGDYIAYLDDDEQACEDWLAKLLDTAVRYQADVVFGPVQAVLPDDAPGWIRRGKFFDRPRYLTGTPRPFGGAGNVLVSMKLLSANSVRFDPAYGLTGGEDTLLFSQLAARGARMIWCDEALVTEKVLTHRMNLRWLILRAYRNGQVYARIFVPPRSVVVKAGWFVLRLAYTALAMVGVLGGMVRPEWAVLAIQKIASNVGQLTFFVHKSEEYRTRP